VSYFDTADGTAYVGDTAGIRVAPGYVLAPTPPPDIDLERWDESLGQIEAWRPARLFLTHFGVSGPPAEHLTQFRQALARSADAVRRSLSAPGDDEARIATFEAWLRDDVRRALPPGAAAAMESAAPFRQLWQGLARYWRKKAAPSPGPTA
jgi:glyoxylase-like metal-dependent hydrolase (beta-lactamase superfamily II)